MNKSKIVIALALFFISFNFLSCDDEPIDPALNLENPSDDCGAPLAFEVSDFIGGTSVNLTWAAAGDTDTWQIQYGPVGFAVGSGTQILATDSDITVNGLVSTNEYEFYIRTVCSATSYSGWVGPVAVGESIGACANPTGVTAARSSGNTEISVSWASGGAVSYQVQYGPAGFALGAGTTVSSAASPKVITGVLATSAYDFYVRANCSGTENSSWAGPIHVTAVGGTPPTDGDYWPTALGNQWTYELDGTAQSPMTIVSIDPVNGNNYFTFSAPSGPASATQRIRKDSGNYYIRTETITLPANPPLPASVTSGNETIILKDYLDVGGTWTDSYVQTTTYTGMPPLTLNITRTYTIMEKGSTYTINGETFDNVIVTQLHQVYTGDTGAGESISTYFFAKDVGPIKIITGTTTQQILSYTIN